MSTSRNTNSEHDSDINDELSDDSTSLPSNNNETVILLAQTILKIINFVLIHLIVLYNCSMEV